jgi:hypothetical protein
VAEALEIEGRIRGELKGSAREPVIVVVHQTTPQKV